MSNKASLAALRLYNYFFVIDIVVLIGYKYDDDSHRRRNATPQLRRVGVGGVYWALEVMQGHKVIHYY